jgi:glycosyltransferase involved in cell wall biosynthesis
MRVSVIISTYNSPEWLEKVLVGYACQDDKNFEIIIADDGSKTDTKALIERIKTENSLDIKHVWHEDQGYRRQVILNKAILQSSTSYLIFTDGDCIPRHDFVSVHIQQARKGYFLSGGYCKISDKLSKAIGSDDIAQQQCFNPGWLKQRGRIGFSQNRKLSVRGILANLLDKLTTAKPTFNNCNSSAWKEDILAVNGYDERMQYGGADREIGERLTNLGIEGKQIRHRAICIHLHHERGYATKESIEKNLLIREQTRKLNAKRTLFGIEKKK